MDNKELEDFKELLRYFVVHLEYCHHNQINKEKKETSPNWFTDVENKIVPNINKKSGQGYRNDAIQTQIEKWCIYPCGRVCISIQCSAKGDYTTKASYLHWDKTGLNINAKWDENNVDKKVDKIEYLYYRNIDELQEDPNPIKITRENLFGQANGLKELYDRFVEAKQNCLTEKVHTIANYLKTNYNVIMTGAPGTGKTFMTESIARKLLKDDGDLPKDQYCFVQFHPSYDYTDFVEGLRPQKNRESDQIVFERQDGIFKSFCAEAAKHENDGKEYVFVIDEINRGEISKIFGELFFSIDPGYRGNKRIIKTQYQNLIDNDESLTDDMTEVSDGRIYYPFKKGFYVPSNVYVIGTMNDIDRSVESMDFAFRRRFSFVEVTASESESMLYNRHGWNREITNDAIKRMQKLNAAIIDPQIGGLTEQYLIGGAYFLKLEKLDFNFDRLWRENLRGVLFEYFRGQPNAIEIVNQLKDAYDLKDNGKK